MGSVKRFILRSESVRQVALLALLEAPIDDPLVEVTMRPYRKDRSLEQNAYMWRLHQAASELIGHTVDELHYYCCTRFLGIKAVMIDDKFISVPYTTTCGPDGKKLTVPEMAKFITEVEAFYASQGVSVDTVYGREKEKTADNEPGSS